MTFDWLRLSNMMNYDLCDLCDDSRLEREGRACICPCILHACLVVIFNDARRCRVIVASALAQVCTMRSNTLYVVAPSHVSVPMSAPMSIRTSFFFMNQRVKGGLYLASRCGGGAAAAGTMLALWSAANSCLACELAVSSSQLPQKVRALRTDAVSTCDLVARGNSVRDITLRDLSQSDLGIQRHGRL